MSTRKRELSDALFDALMAEDSDALWDELGAEACSAMLYEAEPVPNPVGSRAELMRAVQAEPVASLFEVAVDVAQRLLRSLATSTEWVDMGPGVRLFHVHEAPPAVAGADVGFVELAEGVDFPWHDHLGEERTLVIEGTLVDTLGNRVGPGEICVLPEGSRHSFRSESGTLLFAVVVDGVKFDGFDEVPGH